MSIEQEPEFKNLKEDYDSLLQDFRKLKNTLKEVITNTKQSGGVSVEGSLVSRKDWERLITIQRI